MIKRFFALYALFITSQIITFCTSPYPSYIDENTIILEKKHSQKRNKKTLTSAIYFHTDCYSYTPIFIIKANSQDALHSSQYSCLVTF